MIEAWISFQFLRPAWLLAIPAMCLLIAWLASRKRTAGWAAYIARDKLAHLLVPANASNPVQKWSLQWLANPLWLLLPTTLGLLALAGPSWQSIDNPVASKQSALVILLDLSPSMLANDLKPNRLQMAKLKLIDLLRKQKDGDTALVAYAGDAHRITPLTNDPATIEALVHTLEPAIMPIQGSQPEAAVDLAVSLFRGANLDSGDIVLITDGIHENAAATIKQNLPPQFRLSILGMGSESGAAIPNSNPDGDAGFLRDAAGNLIMAKLDSQSLEALAQHFDGRYTTISADNSDIDYLTGIKAQTVSLVVREDVVQFDTQHDAGYWLVLFVLPFAAFALRRHLVWVVFPIVLLPIDSRAFDWNDLWLNKDQQAAISLRENNPELAAQQFVDSRWRATALYRSEQYEQAAELYRQFDSADDLYNLGNALAKAGHLQDALFNYELAAQSYLAQLQDDSQNASLLNKFQDTLFNNRLIRAMLQAETEPDTPEQGGSTGEGDEDGSQNTSTDPASDDSPATAQQQVAIGGTVGAGQTLDQQALQEQGASGSSETNESNTEVADDATESTDDEITGGEEFAADETDSLTVQTAEENDNKVLNPYSEQWLRNLPLDPGGYMRRKFSYQAQIRQQNNEGVAPVVEEGRY